jgi:4-hydroxythreonine-4-phosphate dehydrogenase
MSSSLPRLAITLGDVAGVGPEVALRASVSQSCRDICRPLLVGNLDIARRAAALIESDIEIEPLLSLAATPSSDTAIGCFDPVDDDVLDVSPGTIDSRAGHAAYEYLAAATRAALAGEIDGIVTAPLNKEALHQGGHPYPGHTEILAELCGVENFAMMLYLPPGNAVRATHGLGVTHVTLHQSIASVPASLSTEGVQEKIQLVNRFLKNIGCAAPRIGVCALNPHAGEGGLFGDEESRLIAPAVSAERDDNIDAAGPFPADTLLMRAVSGEFDGVVAMYHDQGHIALKLIGFDIAVNVTLGLPIVRTSPSHGTAFDIAWQGDANPTGLLEAIKVAAQLTTNH